MPKPLELAPASRLQALDWWDFQRDYALSRALALAPVSVPLASVTRCVRLALPGRRRARWMLEFNGGQDRIMLSQKPADLPSGLYADSGWLALMLEDWRAVLSRPLESLLLPGVP